MSTTESAQSTPVESPLTLKELAGVLVKHYGLKEGIYEPIVEFNIGVGNIGPSPDKVAPSAIVGITKIGLLKVPNASLHSVDASKLKPARKSPTKPA